MHSKQPMAAVERIQRVLLSLVLCLGHPHAHFVRTRVCVCVRFVCAVPGSCFCSCVRVLAYLCVYRFLPFVANCCWHDTTSCTMFSFCLHCFWGGEHTHTLARSLTLCSHCGLWVAFWYARFVWLFCSFQSSCRWFHIVVVLVAVAKVFANGFLFLLPVAIINCIVVLCLLLLPSLNMHSHSYGICTVGCRAEISRTRWKHYKLIDKWRHDDIMLRLFIAIIKTCRIIKQTVTATLCMF